MRSLNVPQNNLMQKCLGLSGINYYKLCSIALCGASERTVVNIYCQGDELKEDEVDCACISYEETGDHFAGPGIYIRGKFNQMFKDI